MKTSRQIAALAAGLLSLSLGCAGPAADKRLPVAQPPVTPATSATPAPSAGSGTNTAAATSGTGISGGSTGTAGAQATSGVGGAKVPMSVQAGAGAAGQSGPKAGSGGASTSSIGRLPVVVATGPAPKIPAVMGDCPEFKTGTMMIAGHRNIMITAGEPGKNGALLFYWHGTSSSAEYEIGRIPAVVRDEIVATGGIIAGFNGTGSPGGKGDCSGTGTHNIADFDVADQIVACAVAKHGIDPRRIYTAGCSAGGLQSGCMAMMRSSYIAATAPNSGGIVSPQPWQDMHSPAVMTMHGGVGDMVIVTFSQTSATFDMAAKDHGSFVVNCDHGGQHCAAPDDLKIGYWQFMKDHPFGFEKSPWASALPAGVPNYCKVL